MAGTWTPTWQPGQAYAVTAAVIPTTFAGFTWRCTAAGTSAAVEPSWPADPSLTPTISDGSATWTVGTGFRQALQAGVMSLVTTFKAANPTIVRSVLTVRPRSFETVDLPCFYLGPMDETIATNQGTRSRAFAGFSGFLVDTMGEQIESNDRMNFAADVFADLFTLNFHAASGRSIFQHVGTRDAEFDDAGGSSISSGGMYVGLEFLFAPTEVLEGRA